MKPLTEQDIIDRSERYERRRWKNNAEPWTWICLAAAYWFCVGVYHEIRIRGTGIFW